MPLRSTATTAISHAAFYDEMSKIAKDQEEKRPLVTKKRVKKLLTTVVPATALGTGLGYATQKLVRRYARPAIAKKFSKGTRLKYAPMALGALGGLAGGLAMMHRKKAVEHLEKDDD